MQFIWKLRIPLVVADADVSQCLTRYRSLAWLDFFREQMGDYSVQYSLWQHQVRDLGEIKLRRVSEEESEISVIGPPRPPDRTPTREEQDALAAISSPLVREAAKIELARKIGAESDELYRRRRRHQERIIQEMTYDLARDPEWKKAKRRLQEVARRPLDDIGARPVGRPPLSGQELIYRLAKAQEAEEIRRKDPSMTWKEIAKQIGWRRGHDEAGVALLRDARTRLGRREKGDPEGLLQDVAQYRRAQETNETKNT